MDVCGDAVMIKTQDLEALIEIQQLVVESKKLEAAAKLLASGAELEAARAALLENSSQLSAARSKHEELLRDIKRVEGDLELVAKRESVDKERLNKTAVPRDVVAIQHELETLAKRRGDLEEVELGLLESRDESNRTMHELATENERLDAALAEAKAVASSKMQDLKSDHTNLAVAISSLRAKVDPELLGVFDRKAARGVAIGRLNKSSCTACNMSLTATALADLHNIPAASLATCPECQAILIR